MKKERPDGAPLSDLFELFDDLFEFLALGGVQHGRDGRAEIVQLRVGKGACALAALRLFVDGAQNVALPLPFQCTRERLCKVRIV